jgi:leader peptidase (prepilin peptidase)/N-methyltransferase
VNALVAEPWIFTMLAALTGACVGSFLNVCVARWPNGMSVVSPPSRCPRCESRIAWYDNVPVLGWVMLRGKCRGCGESISPRYPVVELTVALGWIAAILVFGPTFTAVRVAVFGTIMFGVALTDATTYLIPDGFTVFGFLFVLACSFVGMFLGDQGPFAAPLDAIIGACAGAGVISIIGWLGEVAMKKEAMGFGDVTLMAVVGAAVGPQRALLTVFAGAAIAAVVFPLLVYPVAWLRARRAGTEFEPPLVPFGVFLAPAALLTLLWGNEAIAWYASLLTAP